MLAALVLHWNVRPVLPLMPDGFGLDLVYQSVLEETPDVPAPVI